MGRPRKYQTDEERMEAKALAKRRRRNDIFSQKQELSRQLDAARRHLARASESAVQIQERQQQDASRHQLCRALESPEQIQERRKQDAARHQLSRAANTPHQRAQLNVANATHAQMRRYHNALQMQNSLQQLARAMKDDESQVAEDYCGEMTEICATCGSKNFAAEKPIDGKFTQCCQKGRVNLPQYEYPKFFQDLMTGADRTYSSNFMTNIRSINSSFAFASMGAKFSAPPGRGPYCFRIHGQIYHRTGTLHPDENENRRFSQLYILDPAEATSVRMNAEANRSCNPNLMREIAMYMEEHNGFAKAYKMLHLVESEAEADALVRGTDIPNIVMAIKQNRSQDPRRYNNPTACEVAVVFENNDGEPPFNRDILIHLKPSPLNGGVSGTQRISILHKNLDALVYPMFFPNGQSGWGDDLRQVGGPKSTRISQLQWYSYMLSVRGFNPLLNGGRLTQQYFVDAYVRIEANRLNYIRTHQTDLRVEDYNIVKESMANGRQAGTISGKTVVLPSSFEGSPRNMQQRYQDAMTIVTKYGKPDLFLTVTCNPKWKEISENLNPWQNGSPEHRPDLIARIFRLKLKNIIADIKGGLFGKVKAIVYVIEFQKRGLPHAHILLILSQKDKLRNEADIDQIVSAEIPDKETHPGLHTLVLQHMMHGPCGTLNPNCPCMDKGVCSKGFPKPFAELTLGNVDGYPIYKRRPGSKFEVRGHPLDNSSVVPYNPYLLKKYNCHINVEVCASIKSVKYLFKYVYKGHDAANIEISINDETSKFVDSRYVSPPEAAWRIWAFPMHHQSHTIIRLSIHLENSQPIYFHEGDAGDNLKQCLNRVSTLMAWFNLNQNDETGFARTLTYREIPEHFVYKRGVWTKRQRGEEKIIGRIYTVNPNDQDRYYLRLLLLHVKGATSFTNLRLVNGIEYNTYRDAAVALGLLLDDSIWRLTLQDAAFFAMPSTLRELFAYICVFGPPLYPRQLWDDFKEQLLDDICFRVHGRNENCVHCESYAMKDVHDILMLHRQNFENFGLPPPAANIPNLNAVVDKVQELAIATDMRESLNLEQRIAFEKILTAANDNKLKSKCFFIDGPGGSGKTYLYKALVHQMKGEGNVVLASATTGIAANLLQGGRTMHSQFGFPIPLNETSVSSIKMTSDVAKSLRKAKIIIVDECTMASKYGLELIDRLLKEIMTTSIHNKNVNPFGGKTFILSGDFRQCLPVLPHATNAALLEITLKRSSLWKEFEHLELRSNMRSVDPKYSTWLIELGNGTLNNADNLGDDVIEIPQEMICHGSIITDVFGEKLCIDVNDLENLEYFCTRAILCPKNDDVDDLNERILARLESEERTYLSDDSIDTDNQDELTHFPVEFLNSLTPSGMPMHCLRLKEGAIIMLLRNLNTKKGLCNGTRLVVISLRNNVILAKVLTGSAAGNNVFIPRIDLCPSETGLPFKLRRRQFPVKVAFAMTINKSQGQTLSYVGIYLPQPVFGHGQLYVAFSRARRSSNVKVKILDSPGQGKLITGSEKVFTTNVVLKSVL